MLRALAVARSESVVVYPDSTPLRRQLPLFLGAARSSVSYSFALTDDTGSRLFVYVHKEGDISFCAVSVQQQQTPLLMRSQNQKGSRPAPRPSAFDGDRGQVLGWRVQARLAGNESALPL